MKARVLKLWKSVWPSWSLLPVLLLVIVVGAFGAFAVDYARMWGVTVEAMAAVATGVAGILSVVRQVHLSGWSRVKWWSRIRVSAPPGYRALRILEWVYSPKTVKRVFRPAVADMQHEHLEALASGKVWKARWVLLRGRCSLVSAAIAQAPFSLLKRLYEIWKAVG
jgi:hypothetical protein